MLKNDNELRYDVGYELAIENAKNLQNCADEIANIKVYGAACSLNILSAEEALKAIFIMLKYFNLDEKIIDFDKVFKDHKTKHKHLSRLMEIRDIQISRFRKTVDGCSNLLESIDNSPEPIKSKGKSALSNIYEMQEFINDYDNLNINFNKITSWLDNANNQKNKGFYLNLENNTWISPNDFTLEQYEKERKYTLAIIDFTYKTKIILEK